MSGDSRDTAIRDAKRFVREVVRDDWEFDPHRSADAARPISSSSIDSTGTLYQNRQVIEWRCREFDSSGSELEPQSSDDDDSDSSLGRRIAETAIERRRKRRRQMDEEMTWNEGLRMWMAQRDAWSGARTRRQIRAQEQKRNLEELRSSSPSNVDSVDSGVDTSAGKPPPSDQKAHSETTEGSGLANTIERSLSISEKERLEEEQSTALDDDKRKESTETGITEPDAHTSKDPSRLTTFPAIDDSNVEDTDEELDEPLIPVAPPFISADNPIRATIGPAIYPSIYAKVVVQGMTPTIPVNLADLTNAMVHGWKADGQWPPKPAVTSIVLQDDASVPKTVSSDNPTQTRRKNSITNAMRKVFHNPFHRRGSTDAASGPGTPGAV
ncbi:uncharacterized protein N7477_008492 [Penicillium maclennaniae]|uniref:uncharacterized protein n=1 Tax=Penicillium maclennaniae TaxID=1343394 RepID=UPI00254022B1|nr:uncharacterized protein N7477_008492 [Penicillium maclennaniae]KAJ5666044.1 hypothetical protein N7477_008492 [Penicillium maclennaniae]